LAPELGSVVKMSGHWFQPDHFTGRLLWSLAGKLWNDGKKGDAAELT
jgi:hypothetical protein